MLCGIYYCLWPYLNWSNNIKPEAMAHWLKYATCAARWQSNHLHPSPERAHTSQSFWFWPSSLCGESQAPSAGAWYVFLLTYTQTLCCRGMCPIFGPLKSNARFAWPLCLFSFGRMLRVLIYSHSLLLLLHLFRRSTCSQQWWVHCLSQAYVVVFSARYSCANLRHLSLERLLWRIIYLILKTDILQTKHIRFLKYDALL